MAKFELTNKVDTEGQDYTHYTILVTFDNPEYVPEHTDQNEDGEEVTFSAYGAPEVTFEQEVILPDADTDKAAQAYADEYEKNYINAHKEN